MKEKNEPPVAYFLTFRTYGTWLHGDRRTSVDMQNNIFQTPRLKPNTLRYRAMQRKLKHSPVLLSLAQRKVVLKSILNVCQYCDWHLYSAHVRSNHVHVVVQSAQPPEYVMRKLKAYGSRELNKQFLHSQGKKYWARHGSTRYIFSSKLLYPVMRYVILEQGDRDVCYYDKWFDQCDTSDFIDD